MIWLLVTLFVPGGLNQGISVDTPTSFTYKVVYPCDGTNVSAVIPSRTQGYLNQYNLLIVTPPWGLDLDLKFDSDVTLELIKPGRRIYVTGDKFDTNFFLKFAAESQDYKILNCSINIPYSNMYRIPYIQSIVLNKKDELCQNPKNGYFDEKKTFTRKIASTTMPTALNEKPETLFTGSAVSSNEKLENIYISFDSLIEKRNREKANSPNTVFSTTPNVLEEIPNVNVVVSSTMSNEKVAEAVFYQKYFEQIIKKKIPEKPTNVPNIPNITEEKKYVNEYTTIRNALVLSRGSNDEQSKEIRPAQGETCGRKKQVQTALIVHGQTATGHWPWHVAIFKIEQYNQKYICGGTLLSKTLVLTAAHCATVQGSAVIPESLSVGLGKHHLFGKDERVQERDVYDVIIHPNFRTLTLDNDIALLKLRSQAVYTDYVQPACLWYEEANRKLPRDLIFGTVVGWGFNYDNSPTYTLQQLTIPLVPELICLKSNPTFFHRQLHDNNKFCAGFANGTSLCNGDSGGGLMIFVTDTPGGTASGSWHVRGIVSAAPSKTDSNICDPDQYTIFTDVEKFLGWIQGYMN